MKSTVLLSSAFLLTFAVGCASTPASTTAATATTASTAVASPDIVDTAVAAGSFNTLATALTAADLVGTLKGDGPFTVFAPTDEAFAKIPKADLDALLADKEKLTAVLLLHVVPGKVMAADVMKMSDGTAVKTAGGQSVTVGVSGAGVTVNKAAVTKTDIEAKNGVIHVVDSVILPST